VTPALVILPDSDPAVLRAVRPTDGPALQHFFDRLTPEDIRLRFFAPLRELPAGHLERLLHFDPERELALVLARTGGADAGEVLAVARIACNHDDRKRAEFAITVRSDLQGQRIGPYLLRQLIEFARERGVREIYGDILSENTAMTAVVEDLGFRVEPLEETTAIRRAVLRL
jgi:acetyltransferase